MKQFDEGERAARPAATAAVEQGQGAVQALARVGVFAISAIIVTCSSAALTPLNDSRGVESPLGAHASPSAQVSEAVLGSAGAPVRAEVQTTAQAPAAARTLRLSSFFAALKELSRKERQTHVRALWFGDSHTAADFWSHRVRQKLQDRFGNGGPGFVELGLNVYRHGGTSVDKGGNWRTEPRAPSYFVRQQGDGIFGLGGMRSVPRGPSSWATVRLDAATLNNLTSTEVTWELVFRAESKGAGFSLDLGDGARQTIDAMSGDGRDAGLRGVVLKSKSNARLLLDSPSGEPQIFGVVVEASAPGFVLDTLGINGARVATALTWDEASFVGEVRRREPELVILSYGTNEVGDEVAPFRYAEHYERLLARLRTAAPSVACLLIGPTDRVLPDWTTSVRVQQIDAVQREVAERLGCAFFSAFDAMGGQGALKTWAYAEPALARKDRVHLTPLGYEVLGDKIVDFLLQGYEQSAP